MTDVFRATSAEEAYTWKKALSGFLIYFVLLYTWALVRSGFAIAYIVNLSTLFFVVGGIFGLAATIVDRLVYVYLSHPEESLSIDVKEHIKKKNYQMALQTLYVRRSEQGKLSLHNALFMICWFVLGLYLVTSSINKFSQGLILGIGLEIVMKILFSWSNLTALKAQIMWPIQREFSDEEFKILLAVFVGAFIFISFLFV